MKLKNLFKKYLTHILTTSLLAATATSSYFINETIVTNQALSSYQVMYQEQVLVSERLSAEVNKLETDKVNLNSQLSALNNNYNALLIVRKNLEDNIAALEIDKLNLNQEIETLESELATLNLEVETLETRITSLNSQIAANAAALSSLSSQIGSLSGQVGSLNNLNSQLNNQVSSLTTQVSSLNTQVSSLNNVVSSLSSQIGDLNVQVLNFETQNLTQIEFAAINQVAQEVIKGTVKIEVTILDDSIVVGSGAVYKYVSAGNKYYVITNDHVIIDRKTNSSIKVINYAGVRFDATWLVSATLNNDLAILEVSGTSSINFSILNFEASTFVPENDSKVMSLGNPRLQNNTVTIGKVLSNNETINVLNAGTYTNVISHNAVINGGSSGGPLINYTPTATPGVYSFKIVGINFAGNFSGQPNPQPYPYQNINGFAINLSKVYQILGTGQSYSLS
jgi:S1-C subfamily serine protease